MANVLKNSSVTEKTTAARDVSGLAGFNLNDLADEGRSRLEQCRTQIRQMLSEAEQQAAELRADADRRGYEEGLARAAVDAEQKLQTAAAQRAKDDLQLIRQAVQEMHSVYEDWMTQYAAALTGTAIRAAERIVGRRLETEREILVQWADEALGNARAAKRLTLAVHPDTFTELGPTLEELVLNSDLPEKTLIVADESVDRSGVVVRQDGGEIRAGVEAQLNRLRELLP